MKKFTQKINAKINLTLEVLGILDGYHLINSLVASVNIPDAVTLYKRNDGLITLKEKGIIVGGKIEKNNAYKAVKAFMERYGTNGVDIVIDKKIPVGGGLGGSSADIAGALIGMAKLYGVGDIEELAQTLGSDVNYMLKGGYAIISGRGERVEPVLIKDKFYLIFITDETMLSAKAVYNKYDEQNGYLVEKEPFSKVVADYIIKGETDKAFNLAYNDLLNPSLTLNPKIGENLELLSSLGANFVNMTGSGSTVFALFKSKKARDKAYKELVKTTSEVNLIKAETVV